MPRSRLGASPAKSPRSSASVPYHFAWTPPHFWALGSIAPKISPRPAPDAAGHARARFTRLYVLLYTLILFASALLLSPTG